MKNFEKYIDEFGIACGFVRKQILKTNDCDSIEDCAECQQMAKEWLLEEYKEPEIDWSKVPVDTPVLVRNCEDEDWVLHYFIIQMPNAPRDYSFCVCGYGKRIQTAKFIAQYKYCKLADGVDATPFLKEV